MPLPLSGHRPLFSYHHLCGPALLCHRPFCAIAPFIPPPSLCSAPSILHTLLCHCLLCTITNFVPLPPLCHRPLCATIHLCHQPLCANASSVLLPPLGHHKLSPSITVLLPPFLATILPLPLCTTVPLWAKWTQNLVKIQKCFYLLPWYLSFIYCSQLNPGELLR
jgi:hypothetical protein